MFTKEILFRKIQSTKFYVFIAVIAISAAIPVVVGDPFLIHVLTLIALFTIYASSWNLLATSGQGSLGHAAFLGIGGFTSSLLAINLGIPPIIGIFIGGFFSAGIGFLIGLTCVRLKAWFLAMVTFGFSVIAETLVSHFDDFTHGVLGFRTPLLVSSGLPFYYFALLLATLSVSAIYVIMKSKIGLTFRAIHQNASESRMIGINTAKYKLYAFVISTFFAGLAGGLYVHFLRYIRVSIFAAGNSFEPLMMSVIGGLGTIEGPIIGSIIIVAIDSYLPIMDKFLDPALGSLFPEVSFVGPYLRFLGLGVFLVIVVIFLPKGVSSLLHKIHNYFREETKKANNIERK
jgi:branched-chain amino acid transport system permease protein